MSDPIVLTANTIPEEWIPEDLTCSLASNFFKEKHMVSECTTGNSLNKSVIISPYRGAFYGSEDLTVVYAYEQNHQEIASVLPRSSYRLVGLDVGRTRASSSEYGVYRFIQFTYDTSKISDDGYFYITYHAFGGEIDRYAYARLIDLINAAAQTGGGSGGGGVSPYDDDVAELEDAVEELSRRLNYTPSASVQVRRAKEASWTTIAYSSAALDAYINLDNPGTMCGTGTFVIVSPYLHGTYDFAYHIIKNQSTINCELSCTVTNQRITPYNSHDSSYFGYVSGNAATPGNMAIPFFRMVVEKDTLTVGEHRLLLQVSMRADAADFGATYPIYISDKTDVVKTPSSASSVGQIFDAWEVGSAETGNNTSISNTVIGLQDYYEVWHGNISLKMIEDMSWTGVSINQQYNVPNIVVPEKTEKGFVIWPFVGMYIEPGSVRSMRVDIYDRWEKKTIATEGLITLGGSNTFYSGITYFTIDHCQLETIWFYSNNRTMIRLYALSGDNSYTNERFDLRAIYIK